MSWRPPAWRTAGSAGARKKERRLSMTGAMYAAISGLKSHMTKLNVIGNNIANVNTYGYKSARTTFRETIYTTLTAGSEGTDVQGGINPNQIGYGCNIGTIDLDMSNGPAVPTGINLDCMIQGDGFFLVGDKTTGVDPTNLNSLMMTKVGDFDFDADGYLVDGAGNVVYGFVTVAGTKNPDTGEFEPSTTPGSGKNTTADPNGNITTGISTALVPIRLPLVANAADANGTYDVGDPIYPGVDDVTGENIDENIANVTDGTRVSVNIDSIKVESSGKIVATTENNEVITVGYIALGKVENPAGLNHITGPYYQAGGSAGDLAITTAGVTLGTGYLNNVAAPTPGAAATGVRIVGSDNSLLSGFLEGSGTDLATEFSEMITTQRGYQANTRIVTVTDTMLEELVNMKR